MNRTEILATTIDMARAGLGFTPADALDCIAAMIGEADPQSDLYDAEVEKLLRLAACIWKLKHGMLSPTVASPAKSPPAGE
jgi:hypothetical protein